MELKLGRGSKNSYDWPTYEEIGNFLEDLASYSKYIVFEKKGKSVKGRPIYLAKITDPSINDENKEIVLITAGVHGLEKAGVWSSLKLMEFLIGDEELACETRKKQIVVFIPAVNPDGYEAEDNLNANGCNLQPDFDTEKNQQPESILTCQILDELKPEVVVDVHGSIVNSWMTEIEWTGYSAHRCDRPFNRKIAYLMAEAAEEAGYPQDYAEEDSEIIISDFGNDAPTTLRYYAYRKYHALAIAMEVGCDAGSFLARMKKLFQIGNSTWPSEHYPGYPVRVMARGWRYFVAVYGKKAVERRKSRIELWGHVGINGIQYELAPGTMACNVNLHPWSYMVKGANIRFRLPNKNKIRIKRAMVNGRDYTSESIYYSSGLRAFVEIPVSKGGYPIETAERYKNSSYIHSFPFEGCLAILEFEESQVE